jgi:hypothetical protein
MPVHTAGLMSGFTVDGTAAQLLGSHRVRERRTVRWCQLR